MRTIMNIFSTAFFSPLGTKTPLFSMFRPRVDYKKRTVVALRTNRKLIFPRRFLVFVAIFDYFSYFINQ